MSEKEKIKLFCTTRYVATIVFELSDIWGCDVPNVRYHSIFFKGYGTYLLEYCYN